MLNGLQMTKSQPQMAKLQEGLAAWLTRGIGKESLKVSFNHLKSGDDRWKKNVVIRVTAMCL